ncbi:gluconokinase [Nigerium massiliense]|uniref:gluconokinase n=1 Tax=Nigerium massiliense TaxID=1522317 RepID=UPI00058E737A|nr:gluconokinase [Nigerium massiliense]
MSFKTSLEDAVLPLVLALDVGSTGTRGGLYDARGLPLKKSNSKVAHAFTTLEDGTSTINADQVTEEIRQCIDYCTGTTDQPIAAVAIDTFASSLVGVDAQGHAITPCYTYADSRCAPQVSYLRSILDEDATQQRTGTRQHTGYLPPRFLWLKQSHPDVFNRVDRWLSLGEYAWQRLIGTTAAGTSTAAWTGMLNRRQGTWDEELCKLVGVDMEQLSPIAPPSKPLTPKKRVSGFGGNLADAVWFAPISDGHSQSIGTGTMDSSQMVLSAATSGAMRVLVEGDLDDIPRGLWCNRIDETRSILGGALNDVGRAVTWLESTLQLPEHEVIEQMLLDDPVPGTPIVLPWFSGERSTGWVGQARAVFQRVSAATTPLELYRGTVEGVAFSYNRMFVELMQVTGRPHEILGTGRVSNDIPGLMQIVADVTTAPVIPITIKRSTLHGTALMALEVIAPDVERAEVTRGDTFQPHRDRFGYYHQRAERFQVLYDKVIAQVN